MVSHPSGSGRPKEGAGEDYASYARAIVNSRKRIDRYFDADMFGDPVLDMLLDLYASASEGREVSMSDAGLASRVSSTTAHRHVAEMVKRGWLIRSDDPADRRRVFLHLSPDADARLYRYLADVSAMTKRR